MKKSPLDILIGHHVALENVTRSRLTINQNLNKTLFTHHFVRLPLSSQERGPGGGVLTCWQSVYSDYPSAVCSNPVSYSATLAGFQHRVFALLESWSCDVRDIAGRFSIEGRRAGDSAKHPGSRQVHCAGAMRPRRIRRFL